MITKISEYITESNLDIRHFLNMTPFEFDQSENGWRSLENENDIFFIIDLYLKKHPNNELSNIMFFHQGQSYAVNNDYKNAIINMEKSLENNDKDWNSYVILTIYFLKQNFKLFIDNYKKLYKNISFDNNKKIINNMKQNFNLSYIDVYSM